MTENNTLDSFSSWDFWREAAAPLALNLSLSAENAAQFLPRLGKEALGFEGGVSAALSLTQSRAPWATGRDESTYLLKLGIKAPLALRCDRCLQALGYALDFTHELHCFKTDKQLNDAESRLSSGTEQDPHNVFDWEGLVIGKRFNLWAQLDEEALLALPLAAQHESCALPVSNSFNSTSPFAKLQGLKR